MLSATGVDAARVERLRELFDTYDVDKSGALEYNELEMLLIELDFELGEEGTLVLHEEFSDVLTADGDTAKKKAISFAAFIHLVAKHERGGAFELRNVESATSTKDFLGIRDFTLSVADALGLADAPRRHSASFDEQGAWSRRVRVWFERRIDWVCAH